MKRSRFWRRLGVVSRAALPRVTEMSVLIAPICGIFPLAFVKPEAWAATDPQDTGPRRDCGGSSDLGDARQHGTDGRSGPAGSNPGRTAAAPPAEVAICGPLVPLSASERRRWQDLMRQLR